MRLARVVLGRISQLPSGLWEAFSALRRQDWEEAGLDAWGCG